MCETNASKFNFYFQYLQLPLQFPSIKSQSRYLSKNKSIQDRHDANVERSVRTDN